MREPLLPSARLSNGDDQKLSSWAPESLSYSYLRHFGAALTGRGTRGIRRTQSALTHIKRKEPKWTGSNCSGMLVPRTTRQRKKAAASPPCCYRGARALGTSSNSGIIDSLTSSHAGELHPNAGWVLILIVSTQGSPFPFSDATITSSLTSASTRTGTSTSRIADPLHIKHAFGWGRSWRRGRTISIVESITDRMLTHEMISHPAWFAI